ncbi:MAG: hypothetical protein SGARI_003989, partial [Bacillariaceae sp.]
MVPPFRYTHEHVPQITLKLQKTPVPKKPRICKRACQGAQNGKCTNPKPPPNGHGWIELDTTLWSLDPDFSTYGVRHDGMEIAFYGEPGTELLKRLTIGWLQINRRVYDTYGDSLQEEAYQGLRKVVYFFKEKASINDLLEDCQRMAKREGLFTERFKDEFNAVVANKKAFEEKVARQAREAAAAAAAAAAAPSAAVVMAAVDRLANLQAEGHQQSQQANQQLRQTMVEGHQQVREENQQATQQLRQAMVEGHQQLSEEITETNTRVTETNTRVDNLENDRDNTNTRVDNHKAETDTRFTNLENETDTRFANHKEETKTEIDNLKEQMATLAMGGNVASTGTAPPQMAQSEASNVAEQSQEVPS